MVLIVVSDDPGWCKSNLRFPGIPTFYSEDFSKAINTQEQTHTAPGKTVHWSFNHKIFDLGVMWQCNHSVFDYGTFGFMGSYLAGGKVATAHNVISSQRETAEEAAMKKANLTDWFFIDAHN